MKINDFENAGKTNPNKANFKRDLAKMVHHQDYSSGLKCKQA